MDTQTRKTYELIKQSARSGESLFYQAIADATDLDLGNPGDRVRLSQRLGVIGEYEHEQGRPLLTAIVLLSSKLEPSGGFYELAKSCDRLPESGDKEDFWKKECEAVWKCWGTEQAKIGT